MSTPQDTPELKLFHGLTPEAYLQQYTGWYQRERIDRINQYATRKLPKPSIPNIDRKVNELNQDIEVAKKNVETQRIYDDHIQLGEEYLKDNSHFEDALQAFRKSLDYATTDEHKFKSSYNIVRTCLYQQDWERAQHVADELQSPPDLTDDQLSLITSQLRCITAFCALPERGYKEILELLNAVTPKLGSSFNEFFILEDLVCVASLGILKLTRADFVTIFADDRLMDVLDVCPPVVRMFKSYYDRDFGTSLRIMSGVTRQCSLIPVMVDSPDDLYHQYFDKCVIEYLKPYQAVNFVQMAKDFQMNRSQIEMKVISLLQRGHIRGVIDAHNHQLIMSTTSYRQQVLSEAVSGIHQTLEDLTLSILSQNVALKRGIVTAREYELAAKKADGGFPGFGPDDMDRSRRRQFDMMRGMGFGGGFSGMRGRGGMRGSSMMGMVEDDLDFSMADTSRRGAPEEDDDYLPQAGPYAPGFRLPDDRRDRRAADHDLDERMDYFPRGGFPSRSPH